MWIDLCPGETTVTLIIHIMANTFFFLKYQRAFSTCCICVLLGNKYDEILKPTETQGRT